MATAFTTRKRIRRFFGRIETWRRCRTSSRCRRAPTRASCSASRLPPSARSPACRRSSGRCFPIKDFAERASLEFVKYELEEPKYDVEECQQRGMTYRRAAEGHAPAHGLGHRRGNRLALDPRHQGAGRLHGRHAAHDRQRHLHRQRHRARHRQPDAPLAGRLLRPRQGQDPQLGQVPVRRPRHPLSRLVARLRVRRQGPRLRPHRPPPQAAGDDAAARARQRRDLQEARRAPIAKGQTLDPAEVHGLSPEEILTSFYGQVVFNRDEEGWNTAVRPRRDAGREADARPGRRQDRQGRWPRPAPS